MSDPKGENKRGNGRLVGAAVGAVICVVVGLVAHLLRPSPCSELMEHELACLEAETSCDAYDAYREELLAKQCDERGEHARCWDDADKARLSAADLCPSESYDHPIRCARNAVVCEPIRKVCMWENGAAKWQVKPCDDPAAQCYSSGTCVTIHQFTR